MIKRKYPNIVRGGISIPLKNKTNYYYMSGRKHSNGGIDIGEDLEVEDGEIMHIGENEVRVFSSVPFLNGRSPAQRVINGENPDKVFAAQERYKKINKINDDGTRKGKRKAEYGEVISRKANKKEEEEHNENIKWINNWLNSRKDILKNNIDDIPFGGYNYELYDSKDNNEFDVTYKENIYNPFLIFSGKNPGDERLNNIINAQIYNAKNVNRYYVGTDKEGYANKPNYGKQGVYVIPDHFNGNGHYIAYKGSPSNYVQIHELTHASNPYPQERYIRTNILNKDEYNNLSNDERNKLARELYGALQQVRYQTNLDPNVIVDEKWIEDNKEIINDSYLQQLSKESLIKLFNDVAINNTENKSNEHHAKLGGFHKNTTNNENITHASNKHNAKYGTRDSMIYKILDFFDVNKKVITDQYHPEMIQARVDHMQSNGDFTKAKDKDDTTRKWLTKVYKDGRGRENDIYDCINSASYIAIGDSSIASNTYFRDHHKKLDFHKVNPKDTKTGDIIQFLEPNGLPSHAGVVIDNDGEIINVKSSTGSGTMNKIREVPVNRDDDRKYYRYKPSKDKRQQMNNPTTNPNHHTLTIIPTWFGDYKIYEKTKQKMGGKTNTKITNDNDYIGLVNNNDNTTFYSITNNGKTSLRMIPSTGEKTKIEHDNRKKALTGALITAGSDLINNIVGSTVGYFANKKALNNLLEPATPIAPTRQQAAKLKTKIEINPQLQKMKEYVADYSRKVDANTNSSQVALARKQMANAKALQVVNELYADKENKETALINQEALHNQEVAAENVKSYNEYLNRLNEYNNAVVNFKNQKILQEAENKISLINNLTSGFTNAANIIGKGITDRNTNTVALLSNPDVSPEYAYKIGAINKRTYKKINKRINNRNNSNNNS